VILFARARGAFVTAACGAAIALLATGGCNENNSPALVRATEGAAVRRVSVDRADLPLVDASAAELTRFRAGDRLFELPFREPDGLGPLYIRASCEACHQADGRGPGLVPKMSVVNADGITTAADQTRLRFGATRRSYVAAGARQPIALPADRNNIRESTRLPPAVFGRGYIEAIADGEIERLAVAAAARTDGIRGRISRVRYDSEPNPGALVHNHRRGQQGIIGRFGLKARIATLDEFAADALQGDMGITSPLRPHEPPNPDGLDDDRKPGVDLPLDAVNALADYLRLIDIPKRDNAAQTRGAALFAATLCAACHVPDLATRADYPVKALAGIRAPVYSDLLLHDMGDDLADGVTDMGATSREWRTAPLIGLRFSSALLHDGRARGVEQAVLAHGGAGSEANISVVRFRALDADARATLVHFVEEL
jgi:CxxC motif-containing protein (DUF1111 family)